MDRLATLPGFASAGTILLYASAFPEEVDTTPLLRVALQSDKRLVCPRIVAKDRTLALFEVDDPKRDLLPGRRGIREPSMHSRSVQPTEVDWALVPGLAFDRLGYRLGRGGGFYDRLLTTLRPDVPCWALILGPQWVEEVPREAHDRPVVGLADHQEVLDLNPQRTVILGGLT